MPQACIQRVCACRPQCDAQGLSISKLSFLGQDPNRPLSPISTRSSTSSESETSRTTGSLTALGSSCSVTSTGFSDHLDAAVWVNLQLVAAIEVIVVGAVVGARL